MSILKNKKFLAICIPVLCILIAFFILLPTVFIPGSRYKAALALYEEGKYEEAIDAFTALGSYRDSEDMIEKCRTAIKDSQYDAALALYNDGKYDEAISAFLALDGYRDSESQILLCRKAIIRNSKVGDILLFGTYEQDDNASDGSEQIEWIVVRKDGNKLLLVSRYALASMPYSSGSGDVTWESSSVRNWLNSEFTASAFSSGELQMIQTTVVTAGKNSEYPTDAGNDVSDKVFLLSAAEAENYFTSYAARKCIPTASAVAGGAFTNANYADDEGRAPCWWWLRTPGEGQTFAADVDYNGFILYSGNSGDTAGGGIRPAMWVDPGD